MELKATLNKPYTDIQRADFIVANNHTLGYEIKETDSALEAWGKTEEEMAEDVKKAERRKLIAQLKELDLETIRPLRAIQAAYFTNEDVTKLKELEQQAKDIRVQLKNL